MAKKAETKKATGKKVTGKTVSEKVQASDPLLEEALKPNGKLETETASDIESPEALAYRRGDVVTIGKGGIEIDATYKAFTCVYEPQGYAIVKKK